MKGYKWSNEAKERRKGVGNPAWKGGNRTKIKISYICDKCKKPRLIQKKSVSKILRGKLRNLCRDCFLQSPERRKSISDAQKILKLGSKNPMWKGDNIKSYTAIHNWVRRHKPKPTWCEECFSRKPYDLANISGEYKRDVNDYKWLCRFCHMNGDGRLNKLLLNGIRLPK